jgi:hypothetical protein
VRDREGEFEPQTLVATDINARPRDLLAWFVSRWRVEVHLPRFALIWA